jgi:hypothetical protein
MITWKFENGTIAFKSQPQNLNRDISKMAHANNIGATTKITIIDGNINNTLPADVSGGDGDTSITPQPTVSKRSKKTATSEQEAVQLPTVSGDVDNVNPESDVVEPNNSDSNSCWAGDWFDGQRV